ncbi:MAG: flavodoxin family protein [Roseivivax sp.]|nr:flavodoxin family protein [Roseivivax sp.]
MICLAYFSGRGHTARLAGHIADGMSEGVPRLVDVTTVADADWQALDRADAIVFGAPTYMGSTAARFDLFLEEASSRWDTQHWADKLAAGFTVATHAAGDKLAALIRLSVYAAQMGMVWVGQTEIGAPVRKDKPGINRDGCWLGLSATASRDKTLLIDPDDAETARRFGARIETAARRWGAGR